MTMEEVNSSSTRITGSSKAAGGPGAGGCPFHNIDWATVVPWENLWLALSATLVVGSYLWIYRWSQKNRPGPKGWPLVGAVPSLLRNWDRLYDYMLEFFEDGHDSIWVPLSFGLRGIYVAEPRLVEHMLKTNFANYPKGHIITKHAEELFGNGIFNSDHEAWKVQRKVASLEFSSSVLRDFSTGVYKDYGIKLLKVISEFAQSNLSMDFQDLFLRMTLDTTSKLGFGVELGCLSTSLPAVPFATAFDRVNELSYHRYFDPLWNLKRRLGMWEEKELYQCVKVLDSFSYNVICKRREEMKDSEVLKNVKTKPDLLSRFMSLTVGSNEGYSDQDLRDIILNFIIAGRDTTGLTLSWFIYNLCLHPEVLEKILEEIQRLEQEESPLKKEGEESGDYFERFAELLTYQCLGKLQYLHATLSETLRLYPAVPLDGKTALADDVLPDGTRVKRGDLVSYCAYAMGRLERVWGPDAKQFKPERWLKHGIFQPESPFKFTSFHAGPRACLGRDSAYLQMKLTAALLIRFFKFEMVPNQQVTYRNMFVLTMTKGIKVTVLPR